MAYSKLIVWGQIEVIAMAAKNIDAPLQKLIHVSELIIHGTVCLGAPPRERGCLGTRLLLDSVLNHVPCQKEIPAARNPPLVTGEIHTPTGFAVAVYSLASQPTLNLITDRFQYRHEEKWSGDLGSIHVNPCNAIIIITE